MDPSLQKEIDQIIVEILPDLIAFRRETHRHPELGFQEYATSERAKALLEKHGLRPTYVLERTGLQCLIRGKKKGDSILLRGDMDCLPLQEEPGLPYCSEYPGRMHACGHDLNTTYAIGCAIVLNRLRSELGGTVKVLLQPAEEGGGGAKCCIEKGVLDDIRPKYGFCLHTHPEHLLGHVGIRNGNATASADTLTIRVKGKGGHAAYPHRTVDPVVISAHLILALQTFVARYHNPLNPLVISMCTVQAGTTTNVTPDEVIMRGTVRSFDRDLRAKLPEQLSNLCRSTAEAFGGECEMEFGMGYPSIVVPPELFEEGYHALVSALGEEHVDKTQLPTMGAEDFGFFAEYFPCAQIRIGTQYDEPRSALPLHNPKILFSEESIPWGIRAGCALAFGLC